MKLHLSRASLLKALFKQMVLVVGIGVAVSAVQAQTANEYQVKAAFILAFAKFVEWPPEAFGDTGSPLIVGVIGNDPFGDTIDQILSRNTANGRHLIVRRFRFGENLRQCHILFISSSEGWRLGKIMESVRGSNVLTIGELSQFNQSGGIIRFVIQNNKVRFDINAGAAGQARLKMSSKLMALSRA